MNRNTLRIQTFMDIARCVSRLSTCSRLSVGAIVVVNRRIVSHGYNGSPPKAPHCIGNDCPGRLDGCRLTIHAEQNAVDFIPRGVADDLSKDLYVTDSPCEACVNAALARGVRRIFFQTPYRLNAHLDHCDLQVYRVVPSGYVMDWRTKELINVEV